ncbi:MAG: hydroxymethylglutaryl-CoA lyase [Chloroflexota bacterium]|nr:hydroxymethylglutaryl-CoA lyase [Chloroflexota bacterium]
MTSLNLPVHVTVYEVGPRDGLQNDPATVSEANKRRFIELLTTAGLPVIEITSFVRPGAIPQLSDAEDVVRDSVRLPGTRFTALVPNLRGMERLDPSRLDGIALFTAASETFSRKNTNAGIAETIERFRPVVKLAREQRLSVRAYISTAFGCPYEGEISPGQVLRVVQELVALGVDELSVSDTIGVATPGQVLSVLDALLPQVDIGRIALHFHDTRGTALANVLAGLQAGVATFDSSAGGLGGCPYAPGASGNLATEDLVYMLNGLGIEAGVSLDGVVAASSFLATVTGRRPASRYYRAAVT